MKIHLFPVIAAALALSGCGKGETPPEPAAGEGAMAAAIGGDASAMRATSTIAANLAASPIHWSLTAALTQAGRSEEHTSELQSLMRSSYAVFSLKKKKKQHRR